jgi:hypothetical protein
LDYISRIDGGQGFRGVNRDANGEITTVDNRYQNAAKQELEGLDFSLIYDFDTAIGNFEFTANAAYLTKYEVSIDALSARVITAAQDTTRYPNLDTGTPTGVGDQILQNGSPEWKTRTSLNWTLNQWGAGIAANYVSEFIDTSTSYNDDAGQNIYLLVDSFTTIDVYASYAFDDSSALEGATSHGLCLNIWLVKHCSFSTRTCNRRFGNF